MKWNFGRSQISFSLKQYAAGGTAVQAWSQDGPYARISIFIEGAPMLPEGQFYLKDWSENAAIAHALIAEGLIELVQPSVLARSGHVVAQAYQFTEHGKQFCQ